ncbi:MAG TPA: T9SS type A sorting domain-containing protein, partial [Saprospiraceae bacterium]|nr:T9SS type A sorting domain-containing protein [Saprospiraceae bacterium]
MKLISLLIALLVVFSAAVQAQSTTTVEKKSKRITITTTKLDENGKPVTETWIAEGDQPEEILKNMAVNPNVIQKIDIEQEASGDKGERLFLFRSAGDHQSIEGTLNDNPNDLNLEVAPNPNKNDDDKVIIISRSSGIGDDHFKSAKWFERDHDGYFFNGHEQKSNCAALGVYVSNYGKDAGCVISGLIDQGGAQEAGMKEGDKIIKLEDYLVTDFPTLYDALSHFLPGDEATVWYERDGKEAKVRVHLKSWADLPGHEWRARGDCGKVEDMKVEKVEPKAKEELQDKQSGIEELKLENAKIYPNPTSGVFAFSFNSSPSPVSISITDVNGKVVYQEDNDNATGYYNKDIDLKDAPAGNYVVT